MDLKEILIDQFKILIYLLGKKISFTSDNESILGYKFRIKRYEHFINQLNNYKGLINEKNLLKFDIGENIFLKAKYILDNPEKVLPAIIRLSHISNKYEKKSEKIKNIINNILGPTKDKGDINIDFFIKNKIGSIKKLTEKVKNKEININDNKKLLVGILLRNKFSINIPYDEISFIKIFLNNILYLFDKNLIITICGSFRREMKNSNDIDVVLIHKKYNTKEKIVESDILNKIIKYLTKCKFIVSKNYAPNNKKFEYLGLCTYNRSYSEYTQDELKKIKEFKLPKGKNIRIDFIIYPFESYYAGIIYRTGPYILIRYIREYADKLGYSFDEYGLYHKKKLINIKSETDFFKKINMPYLEPKDRTYYNIVKKLVVRQTDIIEKIHLVR